MAASKHKSHLTVASWAVKTNLETMKMNNVMLDLETMGNGSNSAVIAIGAVFFDPVTGELGADFYQAIELESAAKFGEMDASTVQWWLQQSEAARELFKDGDKLPLNHALIEFTEWLGQIDGFKNRVMWGNGSSFDNVILRNAYKAIDYTCPWPFYGERDVRTVVDIGRQIKDVDPKKTLTFQGVPHNALDDARHQARYVSEIYKALTNKE
jgi:exodeoxyribonuclease VIII